MWGKKSRLHIIVKHCIPALTYGVGSIMLLVRKMGEAKYRKKFRLKSNQGFFVCVRFKKYMLTDIPNPTALQLFRKDKYTNRSVFGLDKLLETYHIQLAAVYAQICFFITIAGMAEYKIDLHKIC